MKTRLLVTIVSIFALSSTCTNNDLNSPENREKIAIEKARKHCATSFQELDWLRTVIRQSEDNIQWKGRIYAVSYSGGKVFVHQPYIMSCLACIVYNCAGENISSSLTQQQHQEITERMQDSVLIYNPLLE